MSIGKKIKEYRELNKMTQKDVSKVLEVKPVTISKYESGILEPSIESLKRLAETFSITVDELINEEEKFDISKINLLEVLREQKELGLKGNLYYNTQIKFSYNTNHIEGSKLTEEQTRYIYETNTILFEKETIARVDDIIETSNHFKLVDYMLDMAQENLTEDLIKRFHKILKEGTMDSRKEWFNVGEYKKLSNEVGIMRTSSPKQTPKNMQNLLNWYNSLTMVTIKDIIEFHARFEKIHPFQAGNGRVGRVIIFKECLKNNIIPFIILDKDKLFYYRGLKEYQNKTEKGYLIDTCLNAQDQYASMIEKYLK